MAQMMPHTRYGFEPNQCLYVYKYVDQKGSTAMLRCYTGGESEAAIAPQVRHHGSMDSTLVLKPRAQDFRSQKQ